MQHQTNDDNKSHSISILEKDRIEIYNLDEFVTAVNNVIKNCDLILVITCFFKKSDTIVPEYFKSMIEEKDIPLFLFNLKIISTEQIVATIFIYYKLIDDEYYLGLHSKTPKEHEGKGYNQILRSLFIMISRYIYINGKPIAYLGSSSIHPAAIAMMMKKFNFRSQHAPMKQLVTRRILSTIIPNMNHHTDLLTSEHQQNFVKFLNSKFGQNFDESEPFVGITKLLSRIPEEKLIEGGWKENVEWKYLYDMDNKTGFNFLSDNNSSIRLNASRIFRESIKTKLEKCYDINALIEMQKLDQELEITESKRQELETQKQQLLNIEHEIRLYESIILKLIMINNDE